MLVDMRAADKLWLLDEWSEFFQLDADDAERDALRDDLRGTVASNLAKAR